MSDHELCINIKLTLRLTFIQYTFTLVYPMLNKYINLDQKISKEFIILLATEYLINFICARAHGIGLPILLVFQVSRLPTL